MLKALILTAAIIAPLGNVTVLPELGTFQQSPTSPTSPTPPTSPPSPTSPSSQSAVPPSAAAVAFARELMDAGLDSLPGGGAEIFAERVRQKICSDKCGTERYLDIHRIAHRLGLRSNVTMLYGHIETMEERCDHMLRARALQDETGGFQAFIPLAFHPDNNQMRKLPAPSGTDTLRVHAVARLMCDNIPHIKAFWIATGVELAQASLWFGVDDLDGTVQEEKIYHMAGSATPEGMSPAQLSRLVRAAGREPLERDTLYNVIEPPVPIGAA